jgi:hypothetical protein
LYLDDVPARPAENRTDDERPGDASADATGVRGRLTTNKLNAPPFEVVRRSPFEVAPR